MGKMSAYAMELEQQRIERGDYMEPCFEPDLSCFEYDIIEPALTNEPMEIPF